MSGSECKGTEYRPRDDLVRILHVDDDQPFLEVSEAYLDMELPAAEVTTVTKPTEALDLLTEHPFDCIVSDYEMPRIDGLELLERVRETYPNLPFLLYTGKGSESIASQAINAGVTGYFQKGGSEQHERLANRVTHAATEYRANLDSKRYSAALQALGYPMYVVDSCGRFTYVNEAFAEFTGYRSEEVVGAEPSLVKTDESTERANEALRSVVSSSGPDVEQFEIEVLTADGEVVPCRDHIAPLPFETEYRGCTGILRDITTQRRRREELAEKNERLEHFISAAAHDLRTPLMTAQTAASMAHQTDDSEFFDQVDEAHDRLERILDELLTVAREGQDTAVTEAVALTEAGRTAWESVETDAADLTVRDSATLAASPSRFRRLLENLFQNAVAHGGETVAVTLGTLDDDAGFYIADDGPGVPAEGREDVFDPGYTTADDGTGFGLSIVTRIADAHGWEVVVTESADGGARFEVTNVEFSSSDGLQVGPAR